METEARKPIWRSHLEQLLRDFSSDNRGAYAVDDRWLAAKAEEWRKVVQLVGWPESNVHRTVTSEINAFRLAEIEKERAALWAKDAEFEKEAAKLQTKALP